MSILSTLTQTGDLYPSTMGGDGKPGYSGTAETSGEKCRFEERHIRTNDRNGEEIMTDGIIFVGPNATVDVDYKMVIDSKSYLILNVALMRTFSVVNHKELLCRRFNG